MNGPTYNKMHKSLKHKADEKNELQKDMYYL